MSLADSFALFSDGIVSAVSFVKLVSADVDSDFSVLVASLAASDDSGDGLSIVMGALVCDFRFRFLRPPGAKASARPSFASGSVRAASAGSSTMTTRFLEPVVDAVDAGLLSFAGAGSGEGVLSVDQNSNATH